MSMMRRAATWCFLAALALLVILSIIGAFLGAARSNDLFNSPPLAVFWFFLATLFVGSLLLFQRIRRSPDVKTFDLRLDDRITAKDQD
jgi:hypothetical protein